jgi:UDP-N-acetyl-2-amino-2-deoxyglucuronate dehydrogenase
MRLALIGTGAIAHLHARAYRNIGYTLQVCTSRTEETGRKFAAQYGVEFVRTAEEACSRADVDFVDVCTLPDVRLEPVRLCARYRKHVQVQKPLATSLTTAREMIRLAADAGLLLNVVSQHRFDDSTMFLARALRDARLGQLLQCDAYVKWHRNDAYYARPGKGTWTTEGGGALITQAIHQVDILRWLAGPVREVSAMWQIGAAHRIESEDVVNALLRYASGATGVIQASTAFTSGYPERVELHGTRGTAIVTGDRLTTWDVKDDVGDAPPLAREAASGASDPMAISLEPFERQFQDFGEAIANGRQPLVSGEAGYQALEVVEAIYAACRSGTGVRLD